ncbi:MAG: cytochrome-c peroxidase [Alphaproteobacteria bacterium]|nr:cytochrome-c peroxidase [Alphaproteobacteria bacterium]
MEPPRLPEAPPLPSTRAEGGPRTTPYRLELPYYIAPMPVPADNPLTEEGVALGRLLFYDPILSKNKRQSCASCHQQRFAFTDGRPRSMGSEGQVVRRNSMSLVNLAWEEAFFWDGRAASLEAQVLVPIQDPKEMNRALEDLVAELQAHPDYPARFEAAFPGQPISPDTLSRAIAQFLRTLVSFNAPIDKVWDEAYDLTPLQQRGTDLLSGPLPQGDLSGVPDLCNHCHEDHRAVTVDRSERHFGLYTSASYLANGLGEDPDDAGRFEVTQDPADRGRFRVPTIRNIAVTGPYMHDGRFETLQEVLEHYDSHLADSPIDPPLSRDGAPLRLQLAPEDIEAMIAALELFTDEQFLQDPRYADPFAAQAAP